VRVARRPQVAATFAAEALLVHHVASAVPVPVPQIARPTPEIQIYRKLHGTPIDEQAEDRALAAELARFLRALHAFPVERAEALGAPAAWRADHADDLAPALPLLDAGERERGERLLDTYRRLEFEPAVIHADLGPEHVLCEGGRITGVIDWGDAGVGDPALDLVWPLFDAAEPFREAFVAAYGVDDATAARTAVFWRLVPWHGVGYGLWTERPEHVERALTEVRARLPGAADDADTMPR
jgi:aminoglycoside phosphotransferase (APT) family kinase protein